MATTVTRTARRPRIQRQRMPRREPPLVRVRVCAGRCCANCDQWLLPREERWKRNQRQPAGRCVTHGWITLATEGCLDCRPAPGCHFAEEGLPDED